MTGLIIFLCIALLAVIAVQIGKATELAAVIRGEEAAELAANNRQAVYGMVFMVGFLIFCIACSVYYKDWILWYGPHTSASEHGHSLDSLFNVTLFFTGIVFVLTHIFLFWYAYKYRYKKGRKALFMPHDNTVEVIWTVIPAVVMCFLVIKGLMAWNVVMADVSPEEDHIEIEAMGQQFAWLIRYPGEDNQLGTRDYRLFKANNPFGQDWEDDKNYDDFHPSEIVLPKGKKVRVRITAKDVLHNFDLPHFRVKMDAIPGLPTYFVFTPTLTTEEYRNNLRESPHYQVPADPEDPDGPQKWETFEYELACAELCGTGHYSMRRIVRIVEPAEYERWLATQSSWYDGNIMGTEDDPNRAANVNKMRNKDFGAAFDKAMASDKEDDKIIRLDYVTFPTNSHELTAESSNQLDYLATTLRKNPSINVEVGGHTDSQGDATANQGLSERRANSVTDYLMKVGKIDGARMTPKGYGPDVPVASNATAEGRQQNRRTELKILAQ